MLTRRVLKSFTLLEMLIVLGIIAVVISLASVSYSNAQKKARDSRRKSDMKLIQSSLEQYYSICGFQYPLGNTSNLIPTIGCTSPSTIILPTAPADPKSGTPYPMPTHEATTYQVCTTLESESPANFCIINQQ